MSIDESGEYEKSLPLQLGALRSQMRLTIHTRYALGLWRGRAPNEEIYGIVGLNGFLLFTNRMIRGVWQDDPYSDWWMLRVEERIEQIKVRLARIRQRLNAAYKNVPAAMSFGENLNIQPVSLAVSASSPLGFLGIYLLADFDEIVRRTALAHHIALIDRATLDRYLDDAAHQLRSLFTMVKDYRYSGATREDFALGNAVAHAAFEQFGEVPPDILNGKQRSRYAPPIYKRSETSAVEQSLQASDQAAPDIDDENTASVTPHEDPSGEEV